MWPQTMVQLAPREAPSLMSVLARGGNIGKYTRGATEYIIFYFNAFVYRDIILDTDAIANMDIVTNVDVLT